MELSSVLKAWSAYDVIHARKWDNYSFIKTRSFCKCFISICHHQIEVPGHFKFNLGYRLVGQRFVIKLSRERIVSIQSAWKNSARGQKGIYDYIHGRVCL